MITGYAFLQETHKPRLLLAGDSTMADKPVFENPERGWGQLIREYFSDSIEIQNHAVNGRSTRSFIYQGRWDSLLNQVRSGDFVMIQFGHNDSKSDDTARYAPAQTDYKANLIKMVRDVRSHNGQPILITPVMRRKFDSLDQFVDQHGEYPDVVRFLADSLKTPLIDLHRLSERLISNAGPEASKKYFLHIPENHFLKYKGKPEDNTHFSEYGAREIAALVCWSIQSQQLQLAAYLKPSGFDGKLAFELPNIYQPHFRRDTLSILQTGAIADGRTLCSAAINQAIQQQAAKGGGTVLIPRGVFLTGPIHLASNINLHLEEGALVLFTPDFTQYPLVVSSFEGVDAARCESPIVAENLENISITGKGIFDGNGYYWRPLKKDKLSESEWKNHLKKYGGVLTADKKLWLSTARALKGYTSNNIGKLKANQTPADFDSIKEFLRPNMLRVFQCKHVHVEGVTFENSPAWTTHFMLSEHISLKNVQVKNPWFGTNTDALDLESCKFVLVEGCNFDTGDDGITLKSGRDAEGRKRNAPTAQVIIRNCTVYRSHGGFVVGSEMSGGVRDIYVSDCNFIGSDIGLRFKTTRGRGGVVERIYVRNIGMKDIVGEAILFDMYYAAKDPVALAGERREPPVVEFKPVDETTPVFRNIQIQDVVCNGASKGIFVRGIPEMPVQNVRIRNAVIQAQEGIDIQEAKEIQLKDITMLNTDTLPVMAVLNARHIKVDQLKYADQATQLVWLRGNRTDSIELLNTRHDAIAVPVLAEYGARKESVSWEKPVVAVPAKTKKKKNRKG